MDHASRLLACALAAAATATGALIAQAPSTSPALRLASPTEDAYLSGPVRIVAKIDPPAAERQVSHVMFFAGGTQVCTIRRPPFDCDWDAGDRVVEQQIRAVAVMRDGTRLVGGVRTRGVVHNETTDVDVVQVTAVVTDGDGRFVRNLKPADFTIYDDDRPQDITDFASENIPLELVAAIDISSSMTEALPGVKEAAKRFLTEIGSSDQVTVLGFNENIFTLARRETDDAMRIRAVDRLAPWGGTALYDVIIRAVEVLGRQPGRRSVVLFSDGDDESSHASLDAAIRRTEGSDATIYAIGQGRAVHVRELQLLLKRLASVSGGRAFFTADPTALRNIFEEILEDLRSQYVLAYAPPSNLRDGKWHRIRVEVMGGHNVRARQGYRLIRR